MSHNPFAVADTATKQIQSSVRQGGVPASALYQVEIKAAYLIPSPWNEKNIDLAIHVELPSGYEHIIKNTVLKDGKPTSFNKKTNKDELMFSYIEASHIIGAALPGKTLGDVYDSIQDKMIDLYNFEQRKDVTTKVKMVTALVGAKLYIGLQRKIANKRTRDDATGEWVDLPERKESLVFGVAGSIEDRRSFTEINDDVTPEDAKDLDKWEKLSAGKDWNAYKEVAAASGVPQGLAASTETVHDFGA